MTVYIQKIFAQLYCTNTEISAAWFAKLFGRSADAAPMEGLLEWHHGSDGGLQVFKNDANAGHGCLTLIVTDIEQEIERLRNSGMDAGEILTGDQAIVSTVVDPDGNQVILAQPRSD